MKKNRKIFDVFKNGCVIFSFIILASYLAAMAFSRDCPALKWVLLFFLFSELLAGANLLLKNEKLSFGSRLGIHFTATAALYFVVIVLCGGFISNGAQTIIAMVIFLLLYIAFAIVFSVIFSARKKKTNKKEKYDSMFK